MRTPSITALFSVLLLAGSAATVAASAWHPIPPQDLSLKQGRVDPDADAEALEWEIQMSDEWSGDIIKSSVTQYRRIKIFNARGKDAFSRVDVTYSKGMRLEGVAARTIRPDGSMISVKKDAIMERTAVKGAGLKEQVVTLAMPALEPGCIIEYRWTTIRYDQPTHYVRIPLQLEIPVEQVRFSIHPLPVPSPEFHMQVRAFNFHMPEFTEDAFGFRSITLPSMVALKKEPFSPPDLSLEAWIAVYYTTEAESPVSSYWRRRAREAYEIWDPLCRASGDVKAAARSVLAETTDPNLVVDRLDEYCRTRIRNSDSSDSGLTASERDWLESEHGPSDYLKRGIADSFGLLKVFVSMARAAGLDARIALVPDRSLCVFTQNEATQYLLTRRCAAVNVLGAWRAIDPSAADLPAGALPWQIQGVDMLTPDPDQAIWLRTPIEPPEQSLRRRTADLKLSEAGTVEGDVSEEITGQEAAQWRRELRSHSAVDREKKLTDQIKSRMSTAEVTAIHFDQGSTPSEPMRLAYHVRVPGYAAKTAQRLFLHPAFFQQGAPSTFASAERKYPVLFDYGWSENDRVTFDIPAGFHVENPPDPAPILLPGIGKQTAKVGLSEDGHQLQLVHSLIFGEGGTLFFPVEEYPKLKKAFDEFHAQDAVVVSLVADAAVPR